MKNMLVLFMTISLIMISCQKSPVTENGNAEFATASGSGKNGNNQNTAVPQAVLQSFAALFGNVTVNQWKLRNDGTWRAHFMNNGVAWEATFTATGTLIKSEPA